MKEWRTHQRTAACFVVLFFSIFCALAGPAQAALVTTHQILNPSGNDAAREKVILFLERSDVQKQLVAMGVDPEQARARTASMTDQEIDRLADRIDQLPAGGGFFETALVITGIVALAFFITDLIGWTDIYKVVNKK
jgi:hypothetical protein